MDGAGEGFGRHSLQREAVRLDRRPADCLSVAGSGTALVVLGDGWAFYARTWCPGRRAGELTRPGADESLTQTLRGLLYGLGPTDPATFTLAAAVLLTAALLAAWLPARRAAGADPVVALRRE